LKKYTKLSLCTFLSIPVVLCTGALISTSIDPEWALKSDHYERNFKLLTMLGRSILYGTFFLCIGLWFLTCYFTLKAKKQSMVWLLLGFLGPLGLPFFYLLRDHDSNLPKQPLNGFALFKRIIFEVFFFGAAWCLAFGAMVLKHDIMIHVRAWMTHTSVDQIIQEQLASSGMWAFSEGLEIFFVFVMLYLLRVVFLSVR
jgi:hypothetical protein